MCTDGDLNFYKFLQDTPCSNRKPKHSQTNTEMFIVTSRQQRRRPHTQRQKG